ncbi:hypothetical protein D088_800019 [Salmonella enterica subsp. houtenae serovar 16:z4,z32:-- str. RKS3027]|nr:hypothetical protein D088_800019 [Salmonella enterica subsp. houtenae serovar 16:z4,z32:-- str. RKS3027]
MHRRGAFFFPCFDFGARQYKDAPLTPFSPLVRSWHTLCNAHSE